jgi:hypothetical protein
MFSVDRTFSQKNHKAGTKEWFFEAREGMIGPFESREAAAQSLQEFIGLWIASGDDGGRSRTPPASTHRGSDLDHLMVLVNSEELKKRLNGS